MLGFWCLIALIDLLMVGRDVWCEFMAFVKRHRGREGDDDDERAAVAYLTRR